MSASGSGQGGVQIRGGSKSAVTPVHFSDPRSVRNNSCDCNPKKYDRNERFVSFPLQF